MTDQNSRCLPGVGNWLDRHTRELPGVIECSISCVGWWAHVIIQLLKQGIPPALTLHLWSVILVCKLYFIFNGHAKVSRIKTKFIHRHTGAYGSSYLLNVSQKLETLWDNMWLWKHGPRPQLQPHLPPCGTQWRSCVNELWHLGGWPTLWPRNWFWMWVQSINNLRGNSQRPDLTQLACKQPAHPVCLVFCPLYSPVLGKPGLREFHQPARCALQVLINPCLSQAVLQICSLHWASNSPN